MRKKRYTRQELVALLKAAGNAGGSVWFFRKPALSEGPFLPWKRKVSRPEEGPFRPRAEA